jgi:hypothetical protein
MAAVLQGPHSRTDVSLRSAKQSHRIMIGSDKHVCIMRCDMSGHVRHAVHTSNIRLALVQQRHLWEADGMPIGGRC